MTNVSKFLQRDSLVQAKRIHSKHVESVGKAQAKISHGIVSLILNILGGEGGGERSSQLSILVVGIAMKGNKECNMERKRGTKRGGAFLLASQSVVLNFSIGIMHMLSVIPVANDPLSHLMSWLFTVQDHFLEESQISGRLLKRCNDRGMSS